MCTYSCIHNICDLTPEILDPMDMNGRTELLMANGTKEVNPVKYERF